MTRWIFSLVAVISLSASMFSSPAEGQELKKVRMGYPAFSMTFLTFFVAKDAGIYKKHGLDVDMVQMAGAVQTSALVAGEIDYLTGITSPLVAAARGLPFKGILPTERGQATFRNAKVASPQLISACAEMTLLAFGLSHRTSDLGL